METETLLSVKERGEVDERKRQRKQKGKVEGNGIRVCLFREPTGREVKNVENSTGGGEGLRTRESEKTR